MVSIFDPSCIYEAYSNSRKAEPHHGDPPPSYDAATGPDSLASTIYDTIPIPPYDFDSTRRVQMDESTAFRVLRIICSTFWLGVVLYIYYQLYKSGG
jgi:hypothetical protein